MNKHEKTRYPLKTGIQTAILYSAAAIFELCGIHTPPAKADHKPVPAVKVTEDETAQPVRDPSVSHSEPQFSVGHRVLWSDGSRGKIISKARWQADDNGKGGDWYYDVMLGAEDDPDNLTWPLPEKGLTARNDEPAADK